MQVSNKSVSDSVMKLKNGDYESGLRKLIVENNWAIEAVDGTGVMPIYKIFVKNDPEDFWITGMDRVAFNEFNNELRKMKIRCISNE